MIEKKLLKEARCIFLDMSFSRDDKLFIHCVFDSKTAKKIRRIKNKHAYIIENAKALNKNHGRFRCYVVLDFNSRLSFTAFVASVCESLSN